MSPEGLIVIKKQAAENPSAQPKQQFITVPWVLYLIYIVNHILWRPKESLKKKY